MVAGEILSLRGGCRYCRASYFPGGAARSVSSFPGVIAPLTWTFCLCALPSTLWVRFCPPNLRRSMNPVSDQGAEMQAPETHVHIAWERGTNRFVASEQDLTAERIAARMNS